MNGYRVGTSIVRGTSSTGALFKAGTGLTFSGRFITDINCDLSASGSLLDFAPANFLNGEALEIGGAFISRLGVVDASDPNITPNISKKVRAKKKVGSTSP